MKYRSLGRTGLEVSVLSYGASPLGSVFRDIDQAEGIRTVHTALELGINFIDVSPYYGLTKAETVLGKALSTVDRDRYILATKVGRYGEDTFDFSAKRVVASVDESLQRLGVDHIDLIQCHDIEFGNLDQIVEETLPALRHLQQTGKVRFVGITGFPLHVFTYVATRAEVDTILSYCNYSLNNTLLTETLPFLEEKQIGIISASPLSMGLLTQRGAPEWHPATDDIKDGCARAAAFCEAKGVDIAKVAIQFAVAHPGIATTLVGTASERNIRKNVEWVNDPLDQQLLHDVQQILSPIHNRTWESGQNGN
jgi:aryl-alcohol dehydrogenase-like predicted oxidoreductase